MEDLLSFATGSLYGNLGLVVVGLIGLYFGAEWLVKGSVDIALVLGISPLVIGLTVVAFGTSAPEMFAGVAFNNAGSPDAAIGNVVGSNICNIALMLGIAAVLRPIPVKPQLFNRDIPILLLASAGFIWMIWDGDITFVEGAVLFGGIFVYLGIIFGAAKRGIDPALAAELEEEVTHTAHTGKSRGKLVFLGIFLVIFGVAVLSFAAKLLTIGAPNVARAFGVSEAIIGLTLVAVGTSLPEIATSVVATIRRQGDIITGNAIGSCIFNLLAVVGLVAVIKPITGVQGIETVDLAVMFGVLVIGLPFMWTKKRIGRFEGIALLAIYAGYCYLLTQR